MVEWPVLEKQIADRPSRHQLRGSVPAGGCEARRLGGSNLQAAASRRVSSPEFGLAILDLLPLADGALYIAEAGIEEITQRTQRRQTCAQASLQGRGRRREVSPDLSCSPPSKPDKRRQRLKLCEWCLLCLKQRGTLSIKFTLPLLLR